MAVSCWCSWYNISKYLFPVPINLLFVLACAYCILNIEKKSYGNIDEVEKHSHQVATKFLNTILNVLLNEK